MFPYTDNLNRGVLSARQSPATAALLVLLLGIHAVSWINGGSGWSLRNLSFVPAAFSVDPWTALPTLITSTFLHADAFHVAGNCLFLWVFGRTLERLLGSLLLFALFPILGVFGLLFQWALDPSSLLPIVGASGAISMLMGGYLALFPSARIKAIVVFGWFFKRFTLPAWGFLFFWSGLQLISLALATGQKDGVAYAVHVGGFMAGVIAAVIWKTSFPFAEEHLERFTVAALQRT